MTKAFAGVTHSKRLRPLAAAGAVALALALTSQPAAAQSSIDFTVSGNSTIRGWTCTVAGTVDVTEGSSATAPGFGDGVQVASLTVPVAEFECPQDEMREHLLEAMRAEEFPEITFQMASYEVGGRGAQVTGSLTILDTTREVTFPLSLSPTGAGVRIEGELPLDMTDYGVEPPEVMLGLLVVRPQIRIQLAGIVTP